jgi:hypothetical protein
MVLNVAGLLKIHGHRNHKEKEVTQRWNDKSRYGKVQKSQLFGKNERLPKKFPYDQESPLLCIYRARGDTRLFSLRSTNYSYAANIEKEPMAGFHFD